MNKVFLIGNLGKDPEARTSTRSDAGGCHFTLATRRSDGEGADWHNITVWGRQAENCLKYLKKGSQVMVDGSIWYKSEVDKQGSRVNYSGITSYNVEFLSRAQAPKQEAADPIPF